MKQTITIPGRPKPQKRHRDARYGGKYDPCKKDKDKFARDVALLFKGKPMAGPVKLEIICDFTKGREETTLVIESDDNAWARPKLGDADNYAKLVMDALNEICWHDDRQITDLRVRKVQA